MLLDDEIKKDLIVRFEESQYVAKIINKRAYEKDISYKEIARFCEKNWKKISDVFVWRILKWEWKWNWINLYFFALAVWFTKSEYLKMVNDATWKKSSLDNISDIDLIEILENSWIKVSIKWRPLRDDERQFLYKFARWIVDEDNII